MMSTKFATGKVMCEDFTLSAQRRRQAAEFLRSRGFDEPANCQGPVDSLARSILWPWSCGKVGLWTWGS